MGAFFSVSTLNTLQSIIFHNIQFIPPFESVHYEQERRKKQLQLITSFENYKMQKSNLLKIILQQKKKVKEKEKLHEWINGSRKMRTIYYAK